MPPTRSSRRRSPSSTRSPICASRSAPTCRRSRAASASTTASARNSCMPARAMAARAFPRTRCALIKTAQDYDVPLRIVEAVASVNDTRKRAMARKVVGGVRRRAARQDGRGARPDLQAQHRRHARGALDPADRRRCRTWAPRCAPTIPRAWSRREQMLADVTYCDDAYDCVEGADAAGDRHRMGAVPRARSRPAQAMLMACPVIVDLRNIYLSRKTCSGRDLPIPAWGVRQPSSPRWSMSRPRKRGGRTATCRREPGIASTRDGLCRSPRFGACPYRKPVPTRIKSGAGILRDMRYAFFSR